MRASEDMGFGRKLVEDLVLDIKSGSPVAAAAAAAAVIVRRDRRAEPLGLWLADLVLAQRLGWPVPVPLLAVGLARRGHGGKVRPGEGSWVAAVAAAYAHSAARAVDLGSDLARRAGALELAVPKLRAKSAGSAIGAILDDDAVSGAAALAGQSDRAVRRLFGRLVSLGAVRELSGRSTFRIYGL